MACLALELGMFRGRWRGPGMRRAAGDWDALLPTIVNHQRMCQAFETVKFLEAVFMKIFGLLLAIIPAMIVATLSAVPTNAQTRTWVSGDQFRLGARPERRALHDHELQ